MLPPITGNNQFGQSPMLQQQIRDFNSKTPAQRQAEYERKVLAQGFKSVAEYEKARDKRYERLRQEDARERARGKSIQDAFDVEKEQDRQVRERSERNRTSPFRPLNDALIKMGDFAVKTIGAGVVGEAYKQFAPPGSEFYQKGTLEEKFKRAGQSIVAQPVQQAVQKAVEQRVKQAIGFTD